MPFSCKNADLKMKFDVIVAIIIPASSTQYYIQTENVLLK